MRLFYLVHISNSVIISTSCVIFVSSCLEGWTRSGGQWLAVWHSYLLYFVICKLNSLFSHRLLVDCSTFAEDGKETTNSDAPENNPQYTTVYVGNLAPEARNYITPWCICYFIFSLLEI